jgi:hypothetical protein
LAKKTARQMQFDWSEESLYEKSLWG